MVDVISYSDRTVTPKFFKSLDRLLVSSVFHTIQGEGPYQGIPCVFIRLSGCNRGEKLKAGVSCSFCDADFAVDEGVWYSFDQLLLKLQAVGLPIVSSRSYLDEFEFHTSKPGSLVVITGGEPLMQQALFPFINFLEEHGFIVQIESNGDFSADKLSKATTLVCSPKANERQKKYPPQDKLAAFDRIDYLKFVVSADPKSVYHTLPDYATEFATKYGCDSVYISPMNTYNRPLMKHEISSVWTSGLMNLKQNSENHAYAAKLCMEKGFKLNIQAHLLINMP